MNWLFKIYIWADAVALSAENWLLRHDGEIEGYLRRKIRLRLAIARKRLRGHLG